MINTMSQESGLGLRPLDRHSAFNSPTFDINAQIRVNETVGSASISPSGRDVVLASREGLHIIDLDSPYSPPRHLVHHSLWDVADVQWSPFASKDSWIVSTSNQKALVWNLSMYSSQAPIEHILHAHSRAITDINFSAHDPEMLATCAVDSFVHCWDLRQTFKPAMTFADWNAGATQVKWNRQDKHILASSHDRFLKIWDTRKGAYPLKTIEAHSTKIYGVDWNRIRQTGIVTCSLDRTIKFWDYSKACDEPERIIRTSFPVWRARHTPFGWGLLAMPQRGDHNLHLYDRRLGDGVPIAGHVEPVHTFTGHHDVVKEFLWRSRGTIEDGIDNRDFQLISWGSDRDLHLHQIDSKHMKLIGHEKGKEVRNKLYLTRLGAVYKSYRDEKPKATTKEVESTTRGNLRPQGIALLTAAFKTGKLPNSGSQSRAETGYMTAAFNTYGRKRLEKNVNPMTWIEGVKIGGRSADTTATHRASRSHVETPEPLSDEMMFVSKKYKKVTFERASVHGREATVTLHGPWGSDDKSVFLRVHFSFPDDYPDVAAPDIKIDRSTSAVSDVVMQKMHDEVFSIIDHYRERRRGSLEAVITYLLGEKDVHESILMIPHDGPEPIFPSPADELSSDDEDGVGAQEDLAASGTILTAPNVPLARSCGALWASDGQLICFFPPKIEAPAFSLDNIRAIDRGRKMPRQFEGFGRLRESPHEPKDKFSDEEDEGSSSGSWTDTSSSSSSDESEDLSHLPARFKVPLAWRPALIRSLQKPSSHSSGDMTRRTRTSKIKSTVSIVDLAHLLPAKRSLAKEYLVYGHGPSVCEHNSAVALRHGLHNLSAVWNLCKQILYDEIPLEEMEQSRRRDPILVLARRNVVKVKRKDSGLELKFDTPEAVANPKLTGRVKWGCHPLASATLIPALFDHFEKQADIQMLAMLSCIFCEPAAKEGMHNALLNLEKNDLPLALKAPGFSLDYFPSQEVAWSQFLERKGTPRVSTPSMNNSGGLDYFSRYHNQYGSLGSSNGPWVSDGGHSDPNTPSGIDNTPPLSRQTTVASSLSTSPDPHARIFRRSNSSLSTAFASLSRPFNLTLSASPPVADRPALERARASEVDLSTSAPTTAISWGINTSYESSPNSPLSRRRSTARTSSFATFPDSYDSDDDAIEDLTDDDNDIVPTSIHPIRTVRPSVKLTLKNQHLFDDEGCASIPLLDTSQANLYVRYRDAYADLLGRWRLHVEQAQILKFNGLTPYWPEEQMVREGWHTPMPPGTNPVPGQSSLANRLLRSTTSEIDNANSQSLRKDSTSPSRPLNPAAIPFVPTPQLFQAHGGITRSDNYSSQDLHGLLVQANLYSEKVDNTQSRDNTSHAYNTLLQQATDRARIKMEKMNTDSRKARKSERACVICWEYVTGMYVICPAGKHRAHAACITCKPEGYLVDYGFNCGCHVDEEESV